jgi:hypothetical protein
MKNHLVCDNYYKILIFNTGIILQGMTNKVSFTFNVGALYMRLATGVEQDE